MYFQRDLLCQNFARKIHSLLPALEENIHSYCVEPIFAFFLCLLNVCARVCVCARVHACLNILGSVFKWYVYAAHPMTFSSYNAHEL